METEEIEPIGNAGPECPAHNFFTDAGEITINGQRVPVVHVTAEQQEAIARMLEAPEGADQRPDLRSWLAVVSRALGAGFLMLVTVGGVGHGPDHPLAHGGGAHTSAASGVVARHHAGRRNEEDPNVECAVPSDECQDSGNQRPECEVRAETCANRTPDGQCRRSNGQSKSFGTAHPTASDSSATSPSASAFGVATEVRELVAGIHRHVAAVRKDVDQLRSTAATMPESVARQVFAVVEKMETSGRWRKAPIIQVFRLYCVEGLAGVEVARRCGCSEGLVSMRLKHLRQQLGRDPAELRQYSSTFEQIEDSLRDPRARRIYRNGAVEGGATDEEIGEG